mmetsp:Transcript_27060/g.38066  ORF Transcript_27060/g.38066 Transcript_27060/m.38066 type:complete len:239 (-) Transcript_27060:16-732(-)
MYTSDNFCSKNVHLTHEVLDNSLSVSQLLGDASSSGKHGKTSVLKLLGNHLTELSIILRSEAKRIKSNITRVVLITQKTGLVKGDILGLDPTNLSTLGFGSGNSNSEKGPELRRNLCKVGDSGSLDGGIPEERSSLDLFTNKETNNGKHTNTSVLDFGLTVTTDSVLIGLGSEVKRVEESSGLDDSGEVFNTEDGCGRGNGLLGGEGSEGGGTGNKGEKDCLLEHLDNRVRRIMKDLV